MSTYLLKFYSCRQRCKKENMVYLYRVAVLLCIACWEVGANNKLATIFEWKQVDFEFPNDDVRAEALESGEFIPQNNVILGVDRWRNKLFVTLPRIKPGVAATLTYIDLRTQEKSPKLKPYPNWEANKLRQNNGVSKITSVYRLNIDACDRLWLVDTGKLNVIRVETVVNMYDPKIQVYDLNTDRLVREYTIPKHALKENSYFSNIIVDVSEDKCEGAFAYLADIWTNALVVYDFLRDESYRIDHPFFHFDPLNCDYNVGGVNFQWAAGIVGLALSPIQSDGFRSLYFHPMSSVHEFSVSTRIIRNKTIASNSYHEYKILGSRGPNSQSLGSSLNEATGILFYTLTQKNAIGCWNINNPEYSAHTNAVLIRNDETVNLVSDLKVDKTGNVWAVADSLSDFIVFVKTRNSSEVNLSIFVASVQDIVKGTVCDGTPSS